MIQREDVERIAVRVAELMREDNKMTKAANVELPKEY